jgi:hypothetical protein
MLSLRTIRAYPRIRVAHPFGHFAKGWGIAHGATALLFLASRSLLHAQSAPCGLTSMTEASQLIYPPIARAAHVSGDVILLTRFDTDGAPVHIAVVSGPPMLQGAALNFVKGWRANGYSGPRECPIVVTFRFVGAPSAECGTPEDESQQPSQPTRRVDLQHFTIGSHNPCFTVIRDPAPMRAHNFLGHRWYSKS